MGLQIENNSLKEDLNSTSSFISQFAEKAVNQINLGIFNGQIYLDGNIYSDSDFQKAKKLKEEIQKKMNEIEKDLFISSLFSTALSSVEKTVTKESVQFGIFLNGKYYDNMDQYLKAKSVRISSDEKIDLAIIENTDGKFDFKNRIPFELDSIENATSENALRVGTKVFLYGFNYGPNIGGTTSGLKAQLTQGFVSQSGDDDRVLYSIPALSGSSGSPVIDEYGKLVSVNFAGISNTQSFNYGIPARRIKMFLNR